MKIFFILLFIICLSVAAKAQSAVSQDTSCSTFKNLKFKQGVDTIVVKAIFTDFGLAPPFTYYELSFLKKKKISTRKSGNSVLRFQPANCSREYSGRLFNFVDSEHLLDNAGANLGITIYVTCVVFNDALLAYKNVPYFIVMKAIPKKPIGSM